MKSVLSQTRASHWDDWDGGEHSSWSPQRDWFGFAGWPRRRASKTYFEAVCRRESASATRNPAGFEWVLRNAKSGAAFRDNARCASRGKEAARRDNVPLSQGYREEDGCRGAAWIRRRVRRFIAQQQQQHGMLAAGHVAKFGATSRR